MKYVKSKIVMLPTKEVSSFGYISETKTFHIYSNNNQFGNSYSLLDNIATPHHLYILSNEEIKVGDVVLHDFGMGFEIENPCDVDNLKSNTRFKIIATTDGSLGLPRPSKEFLEKYCELGEIKEVLVEYTDEEIEETFVEGSDRWSKKIISPSILKVASDNTITIKLIKDSWNRDDIKNILLQFAKDCGMDEDLYSHYNGDYKGLDNWIKENL